MCLYCSESNEHMEPNDNEMSGHTREEDNLSSSTLGVANHEEGTAQKDASSPHEASFSSPSISLTSCESFASNSSEYSVDVNPYVDRHSREDNGGSETVQEDPRYRLYHPHESSNDLKTNQKQQGENGSKSALDLIGYPGINDDSTSSDEFSDVADEPSPTFFERDEIWDPPGAENKMDDEANSMSILDDDDDDDDDESANADISEWAMPRLKEKKMESQKVKDGKFKELVSQLLRKVGVEISDGMADNWVDIVTDLAWKAAIFLKPGANEGKVMDPSGYVKIKCVGAGSRGESRLIKGLVFKKHAAHKHMVTKYKKPRLLLIKGMLGPSFGSSGLSSFNSMLSEDQVTQVNLDDLIQNLQACQPNVILVEKSASRDVIEKILQMGVTLVLDMKHDRLERVARCTRSTIFSSDATFNQKLIHCESLYFEKFKEEHAIVAEGVKKPSKTLMFLEGCPTNFGCTILLKGSHGEELKKIKCVVQCAVVMAYHFLLETSFLVDQEAMFATIAMENTTDISPANEQPVSTVSENSSISHHGESDLGNSSADGAQVSVSSGSFLESSNVQEPTTHDIAVSNGFQEEESCQAKEFIAKDSEIASPSGIDDKVSSAMQLASGSHYCEPRMTSLSAARSLSRALEKVSIVSPATYESMSTYIDLNGKEPESQTAVSIPISPIEETAGHCDIDANNKSEEDKTFDDDAQAVSTSSTVDGEAKAPAEDCEESIRAKDEINSVLDSESILVLMSSRNVSKGTICEQSHFTHIKFYRNFDVPLGKFLRDNLFNQTLKCEACGEFPEAHYYYYAHHSKQLTIRVKRLGKNHLPRESEGKLWMWSRCSKCEPEKGKATKRVLISKAARCLSFGKFLELSFSSHSTFNRPSSCGHSFQKDFLYFFGFGSMVAMFQYSRVAIYAVSVPAHKLEFSSSINKEWLEPEIRTVYTTGLLLFKELKEYLKKIESRFSGWNLILNGFSKGFSDILDLLKLERSEFEKNFNKKNEDSHDSVYKLLILNRLRWEILLEACVWDRRLESLLSSSSNPLQSSEAGTNEVTQRQMVLKEYGNSGEEAKGSKISAEAAERHMLLEEHKSGSEGEGAQMNADKALIEQMDSEKGLDDRAVEATAKVVEGQTGLNNESAGDIKSNGDDRTLENCNDVNVQIEMVAETEKISAKESPNDGILQGHREQDLISLPIAEEDNQRPPSCDSVPSVLCQESNGSVSIKIDEENSNCSADGEVSERPNSPPLLKLDSSLWNSFGQIREECMEDLLEGRPPKFGHLPKFEQFHSPDFLPIVRTVITEEGSRLHMPLREGDYIVSDFDCEISSYIACALARTENFSHMSSDNDENISLKRAASEPRPLSGSHDADLIHSSSSMTFTESHLANFDGSNRMDSVVSNGRVYKEVNIGFEQYPMKGKHSVVIIYPNEFRSLRNRCCPSELDYIASLSRCKIWDAKGGKSKSVFAKTLDERLIIKEIKKTEFDSFMKFAPAYFRHMTVSVDSGNQTCLAKILGLYQVTIRNQSGKETKHDLMVQENLSFGRNITRQYDLKGALRARFTETADGAGDVLLDQNFVKDMKSSPLYIGQKYKRLLQRAVWNDTTFLNNIGVMDYSLLVGVDRKRRDLVCGIIDYLRQYTWDKQFETWVKSSLAPKSDAPTIISPQEYKKRFRKFMDTHFLTVPDDWCFHRPSNPCKLCGAKVHDSSVAKLQKREEELKNVQALDQ